MLLADLLNGLLYNIGNLISTEAKVIGLLALIIPITLFVIASKLFIFIAPLTCWRKLDNEELFKSTCLELYSMIGLIFYFVGDNFHQVNEIQNNIFLSNINDTQQQSNAFIQINTFQAPFLMLGIIYFRAFPYTINRFLGKGKKLKTKDSIYTGILNIVVVTTEFDAWFTLLQTVGDCSTEHITLVWTMWIAMIMLYTAAMFMSGIRGWYECGDENNPELCGSDMKIHLVCGILIKILIVMAFAFYLISDNRQPLECCQSPHGITIIRLIFVTFSFFVYLVYSIFGGIHYCIITNKDY